MKRISYASMIGIVGVNLLAVGGHLRAVYGAEVEQSKPPTPAALTPLNPDMEWRPLRLQHVAAGIMAFWIDPDNNDVPEGLMKLGVRGEVKPREVASPSGSDNRRKMPDGVAQVVPVESRQTLLALGTLEGLQQLADMVAFMDKPIPVVELSVQIVAVSPSDTETFSPGIFSRGFAPAASPLSVMYCRGDSQAHLEDLVRQQKARVVFSRHVKEESNFLTIMGAATGKPVVLGAKDDAGAFKPLPQALSVGVATDLVLETGWKIGVTPAVNTDGTITLYVNASQNLRLNTKKEKSSDPTVLRNQSMVTVAIVAENDTIALGGMQLEPSFVFPAKGPGGPAPSNNVVVFVKAHKIEG